MHFTHLPTGEWFSFARRRKRDEKRACGDTMEAFGRTQGSHPISSHMSRSPIHATFTSSILTTTTPLFPAPPFDNPTTLSARRHTHEFPRIFASPTAIKGMMDTQEFTFVSIEPWTCYDDETGRTSRPTLLKGESTRLETQYRAVRNP